MSAVPDVASGTGFGLGKDVFVLMSEHYNRFGIAAFIVAVLLCCATIMPAKAQDKPDILKAPVPGKELIPRVSPDETYSFEPKRLELNVKEKLEYAILWNGMPAGEARLEVKSRERMGDPNRGPEVYVVSCKTRSNRIVSSFYEVKDDVKTMIDVEGGFSRYFHMEKQEGSIKEREKITFDYSPARMVAVYEMGNPDGARIRNVPVPGACHDPLSCLYYLRRTPLKLGGTVKMLVNTERRNWELKVKVVRREVVEIPCLGEEIQCLVVEPEMQFRGIFERKGKMLVWLEENTHVPVRMDVEAPIGAVQVFLSKAENSPLNREFEAPAGQDDKK